MKKLRKTIEDLNLNLKKEISILLIGNVILIAILILLLVFKVTYLFSVGVGVGILLFNYTYLNRYNILKIRKKEKLELEFIELFTYLRIYLFNNETVYTALKNISEFSTFEMKSRLEILIEEIDKDKTVQPFINFASQFKNRLVEEVMISLYEMVNNGTNDLYINQFIKVFEDYKNRFEKERENKRYQKFDTYNMLSLIGSGIIMVILSLAVISLIGEVSSGI